MAARRRMSDDLYHQAILDLARRATGHGRLEAPQASVRVDNPLCGDRVTLDLDLVDGRVSAVAHQVRGCLLCQAAAAVIGARAPGESPTALRENAERLLLQRETDAPLAQFPRAEVHLEGAEPHDDRRGWEGCLHAFPIEWIVA